MQEILSKNSLIFLHILFVIYQTISYYSKLIGIDPGDCPTDIPADIVQENGQTFLKLSFSAIEQEKISILEMKSYLQDYLQYAIMPKQNFLRPYQYGHLEHQFCCPLYIYKIENETHENGQCYYHFYVIWIDNKSAYEVMRKAENFPPVERSN